MQPEVTQPEVVAGGIDATGGCATGGCGGQGGCNLWLCNGGSFRVKGIPWQPGVAMVTMRATFLRLV